MVQVSMLKPKQECGSLRWGLDRLWLSCLDWSDAARYGDWVQPPTALSGSWRISSRKPRSASGLRVVEFCGREIGPGCRCGRPFRTHKTSAVWVNVTGSRCGKMMVSEEGGTERLVCPAMKRCSFCGAGAGRASYAPRWPPCMRVEAIDPTSWAGDGHM